MTKPKRGLIKKYTKPEISYKVVPKRLVLKNKQKKPKPKFKILKKCTAKIKMHASSLFLILIFTIIFISIFWFIKTAVTNTDNSYENSLNVAKSFLIVDSKKVQVASVVGSNYQLEKEIENFQSAPDDLKAFILKDYREFKGNCVVNGKLIGPVEYKLENVVYDQFARLKRTCITNDSAIIAKIGGRWSFVTVGNVLPECRVVNDLNLPQGVTFNCTDGMVIYTNPNP